MFITILVLFMLYLIYFLTTICIRYGYISKLALKNNFDFTSHYIKENIFNKDTMFNRITDSIALSLFKMNNKY
ncbi:MAG: hypothetical protein J6D47_17660 [Peptostreptococcaceae bacterium]|jgi:hypothetical protein|nr:hypothetical protein [Peptostreptococcaceae bacterium]